jgi:acyl-CoA synthetase (AMP-forming)/AMP-acid ligase II
MAEIAGPAFDAASYARSGRPLTIGGFLLEVCQRYAGNEALVFDDPLVGGQTVRWSYAELEAQSRQFARALLAAGVGKGSRVATVLSNRPEAVAAYFGAALAGAVIVPLSTFATKLELADLIAASDATVLIVQTSMGSRDFAADLESLLSHLGNPVRSEKFPYLRHLVAVGPEAARRGLLGWDEFLLDGDGIRTELLDAAAAAVTPSDLGLAMFSSGTTATPKGVLHNHQAPTLQFWAQAELFGRHEQTRMWTALPMFWTAGMNTAMGATLAAGGCWVMQEGFDAGAALALMQREKVTEPYTLPHQARTIAEHPDWERTDLSSLKCVFGKSVFAKHPSVTGDPDWQMPVGWGMSETCAFISAVPSTGGREAMKASLGPLLPGNRLKVVDPDTGEGLPVGEDGELLIKGPTLMEHYLGKSREQCFDSDGWFRTGDIGHVDDQDRVHWSGRRTEMIKSGGANISPAEIEVALRAYPRSALARVIAMPCLELVDGAEPDDADVTGFLRERIAAYKVPKRVLYFAPGEIPLTASKTKVVDDELRKLVEQRMGQQ